MPTMQTGRLTCERCGCAGPELSFGSGRRIERQLRVCQRCGTINSVLTRSMDPETGWWREHDGRGHCSGTAFGSDTPCGSTALVPYDGGPFGQVPVDACPECGWTRWVKELNATADA